jgi:hypothetical protein
MTSRRLRKLRRENSAAGLLQQRQVEFRLTPAERDWFFYLGSDQLELWPDAMHWSPDGSPEVRPEP